MISVDAKDPTIIRRIPFLLPLAFLCVGLTQHSSFASWSLFPVVATLGVATLLCLNPRSPRVLTTIVLLLCATAGAVISPNLDRSRIRAEEDRSAISEYAERHLPRELGVFVRSVLLGEREAMSFEEQSAYRRTGLTHLLAVSGLHVGLLSLVFLGIGWLVFGPRKESCIIAAGATVVYVAGIGMPASALRAGIMSLLLLMSAARGRRSDLLNVLAATAFVTILLDPAEIADVGFQLSYAATLGILLWTRPLTRLFPKAPRQCWGLLAATTAAQVTTLPIALWHFESFAPISFVANLFAIPIFTLAMFATLGALVGIPFAAEVALLVLGALQHTVALFASLPGAAFRIERPSLSAIALMLTMAVLPLVSGVRQRIGAALILLAFLVSFM